MKTVELTVNGERCRATVSGRTQLAELLRDHLHLTGTHLGCEHGVCGACTVLMDGKPVRSCIAYAQACEGADVVTVEGLGDDPTGRALSEAFARHHALQCGFCTSGMLITAWDIVTRLAPTDEAAIRHELSGNLCRCTGYMGIVAAVRDVALQRRDGATPGAGIVTGTEAALMVDGMDDASHASAHRGEPPVPTAGQERGAGTGISAGTAFEPFEIDPVHLTPGDTTTAGVPVTVAARPMSTADGWSLVEREFTVEQPVDALWALFEDLPRVAGCLPGVHVESSDSDRFAGRVEIRFGPVAAAFRGDGTRKTDAGRRTGVISGRGSDPRGHTTLDAELRYTMNGEEPLDAQPQSRVDLAIRFRIQGGLAQFNRADLVESFADVMLAEFVANCERRLAGEEVRAMADASGFTLLWRMIKARLRF